MKNMEHSDNTVLPTLEELQRRFDAVPRFCAPCKCEYVWFKADDAARVFGFNALSAEILHSINKTDRMTLQFDSPCGNFHNHCSYGPEYQEFITKHRNVINQYGVAQLAQRTRFPLHIRFKYWLYST